MVDLQSSPAHDKPSMDVLFPDLKKAGAGIPAPRFLAPAAGAAGLLGKGTPPSSRPVPAPPSGRMAVPAPPSARVPAPPSARVPAPPSARLAPPSRVPAPPSSRVAAPPRPAAITTSPDLLEEVEAEALPTSPEASPAPIQPAEDAYVDDGPTILKPSPFLGAPIGARPQLTAPPSVKSAPAPVPPPSRRAAPPPSASKLPPLPTPPASANKLPPVPSLAPSSLSNLMPPSAPHVSDSAPTTSPPPVQELAPMSAPRVSARAAALVAPAADQQRYVPPSAPPPSVRPAQETIPASRYSLAPMSLTDSIPAPAYSIPPAKKSNGTLFGLVAAAGIGIAACAGFFAVKGSKALGFGGKSNGTMIVTAAGPNDAPVKGVRVFTDGVVRCEESPCRLSDVTTGTHFVSVDAPGYTATAARAVSVDGNSEASLHVELVPDATAKTADAPKPQATTTLTELAPEKTATSDAAPKAKNDSPKSTARGNEKAEKKAAVAKDEPAKDTKKDAKDGASAAGDATLNINSIPMANVVLDGRPMGSTPLVGVHVTPGSHSVVFIHPEKGRKSAGATVKAGGAATVAVRF